MLSPQKQATADIQVINISAQILSHEQVSVLSRGLSFAPSCHFNVYRTMLDLNKFVRNIVIKRHFGVNVNDNASVQTGMPDSCVSQVESDNIVQGVDEFEGNNNIGHIFSDQVLFSQLQSLELECNNENVQVQDTIAVPLGNSFFYPVQSRTPSMDTFQELMLRDLIALDRKTKVSTKCDNLSKRERAALND